MKHLVFAGILSLSLLVIPYSGAAAAAAKMDTLTIKFAHTGVEGHPSSIAVKIWRPLLDKASGGAITIQEFPNSQLGSDRELAEGTRMGTIDMTIIAAEGALPGFVPVMQVMGLPFIFRDREHVYKTLAGPVGKELESRILAGGFVPLAFTELGFRNITTRNKAVMVPDDLKGLKMRVQESNVWLAFMKALGAIPTPIPFGELYSALQQGVVDGQENPVKDSLGYPYPAFTVFMCGSKRSRRASPMRLIPSTVRRIARPGNVGSHHFWKT